VTFPRLATVVTVLAGLAAGCGGPSPGPSKAGESRDAYRAHLEAALTLERRGDLRGAASQAARALVASPGESEPYAVISRLYVGLGDDEAAAQFFGMAARRYPDLAEPRYWEGFHEFRLSHWAEALAAFRAASAIAPRDPRSHFRQGLVLQAMGDFDGSLSQLRRARELDPGDATIAARLSRSLRITGAYDEAERVVREALATSPGSSDLHYALGQLLLRQGLDDEAEQALRRAIALAPGRWDAHHDLARLLARTGREDEGRREWLRAGRLRDYADARNALLGRMASMPDDPDVTLRLAELDLTEGNTAEAARWLDRATQLGAAPARAGAARAQLAVVTGNLPAAESLAATLGDSHDPRVELARAAVALAAGRHEEGLERLRDAIARGPRERAFLRRAADLLARAGLEAQSDDLLERAAAIPEEYASATTPGMRSD
jgi:tetratricopeptide (TPR) repeat protein